MMKNLFAQKLKIWEAALLISLCAALCAGTWAQGRMENIRGGLMRLHVIAASDEEYEQALKLRVRDAVLEYLGPKLENAESRREAEEIIRLSIPGIARSAAAAAEGRRVSVTLGQESYPTRYYGGFSLPGGRYDSLRVVLDEGKGQNWWCVVFPPLCTGAVTAEAVETLGGQEKAIITQSEDYRLAFRLLEIWGELTDRQK